MASAALEALGPLTQLRQRLLQCLECLLQQRQAGIQGLLTLQGIAMQAADITVHRQAQIARGFFQCAAQRNQGWHIARRLQALGTTVTRQLQHLSGAGGLAEKQRGGVGQLMRLIQPRPTLAMARPLR